MTIASERIEQQLEQHRTELTRYCYRMLASPFEAEDAVQETMLRAWRRFESFERRAALRSWLYRIATNVCFDMLNGRNRRARPMDLGGAGAPEAANLNSLPEVTWIEPIPTDAAEEADPAEVAVQRETMRLAFVAALQHLPPRQRAALILCEVLRWKASEAAELLDTSVASINSALQRARATIEASGISSTDAPPAMDEPERELLARYVEAFESYDMDALTVADPRGRDPVDAAVRPVAERPRRHPRVVVRPRDRLQGLAAGADVSWPTARSRSASTSRASRAAVTIPGRCRCSSLPRRQDRRVHVLPEHRAAVPAVRAASAPGLTYSVRTSCSPMNATRSRSWGDDWRSRTLQPWR